MTSKLSHVATAGISVLACTAMWIGCGGSSATTGSVPDSGAPAEAGPTGEAGTFMDSGPPMEAATKPDASITGPYLDIQYGSCPTLTACGGDPTGLWKVTGGCVDDTIFDAAKAQCMGLVASNVKFQARGTVFADATTIQRNTDVKFTAKFAIPAACKTANPLGMTCAAAEQGIKFAGGLDTATCTDDAATGGCTCDVGNTTIDSTSDAYTTSGNVLTTGAGMTARTYDYCVMGTEIKYKESTAKTAIPALFTLSK